MTSVEQCSPSEY